MNKAIALSATTFAVLAFPMLAAAATITNLSGVGTTIIDIINTILVPVIFAIAFIVFIWGAFLTFILGATSEETKDKGKNLMLWGLIGFFVMVSVWGLVNILTGTFATDATKPTFPTTGAIPAAP